MTWDRLFEHTCQRMQQVLHAAIWRRISVVAGHKLIRTAQGAGSTKAGSCIGTWLNCCGTYALNPGTRGEMSKHIIKYEYHVRAF